jgi:hypothetical protein
MTSYQEAEQIAKDADKKLDFSSRGLVLIIHEEGSVLTFQNALLKEWKDYIFIFTEHHGTHVYHKTDLSSYANYTRQETEKLKNTGYIDKCQFCNKDFKVEELEYGHHPDCNLYNETEYFFYCEDCGEVEACEHKELWKSLNKAGSYNAEKDCQEPWGFTWGHSDLEHIKKACATIITDVDAWLDAPNSQLAETPRKAIENGDYEEIYLIMYRVGVGEFS